LGVDAFYLYDQGSDDSWVKEVEDYMEKKVIVKVLPWSFGLSPSVREQKSAFLHCRKTFGKNAVWQAFIDMDEFFVIASNGSFHPSVPLAPTGVTPTDLPPDPSYKEPPIDKRNMSLPYIFQNYINYPGLMIDRQDHGPYPNIKRPQGLTIANYLRHGTNTPLVKSVSQPSKVAGFGCGEGVHSWKYDDGSFGYDMNGSRRKECGYEKPRVEHTLWLNHYWIKSRDDFDENRKPWDATQGLLANWTFWYEESQNKWKDNYRILEYLPALKEKINNRCC